MVIENQTLEGALRPHLNHFFMVNSWDELNGFLAVVQEQSEASLRRDLGKIGGGPLICFGAGYNGNLMVRVLNSLGINVSMFADNDSKRWGSASCALPVVAPEEIRKNSQVFIAIYDDKAKNAIGLQLEKLGLSWQEPTRLIQQICHAKLISDSLVAFKAHWADFQRVYELLSDDLSRKIYLNVLKARISLFDQCRIFYMLSEGATYWALPEFRNIPDATFVDIGAFTGDTVESFLHNNLPAGVRKIHAFEPCSEIFDILEKNAALLTEKFQLPANLISCHNSAVTGPGIVEESKVEFPPMNLPLFQTHVTGTAVIAACEYGSELPMMAFDSQDNACMLDTCLDGEKIDFIKIDVEGGDLKSLRGAANIIKKQAPRLSVAIYHHHRDLFSIPLYIHSLIPEYTMSIRHHSADIFDTILYCHVR